MKKIITIFLLLVSIPNIGQVSGVLDASWKTGLSGIGEALSYYPYGNEKFYIGYNYREYMNSVTPICEVGGTLFPTSETLAGSVNVTYTGYVLNTFAMYGGDTTCNYYVAATVKFFPMINLNGNLTTVTNNKILQGSRTLPCVSRS